MTRTKQEFFIILFLGALLFGSGLGYLDFLGSTEGRSGQISREMLRSGDWVIPHLNGEPRLTKPPLYFWMVCLSSLAINHGQVNEFAARLPVALSGILMLLMTWAMGRRLYGNRIGFIAALMLATMYRFFVQARQASLDLPFAMFITAGFMSFVYGVTAQQGKRRYYRLMYVCIGLALMVKGPVALVVHWLGCITYLCATRRFNEFKHLQYIPGIVIMTIIVAPWAVAVVSQIDVAYHIFYRETIARFSEAYDHIRPFYYYIYQTPFCLLPWGILSPFVVWDAWKSRRSGVYTFPLSFIIPGIVFFSLSQSKQSHYLMPLYPFMALCIAFFVDRIPQVFSGSSAFSRRVLNMYRSKRTGYVVIIGLFLLYAVCLAAMPWINKKESMAPFASEVNELVSHEAPLIAYIYQRPYLLFYLDRNVLVANDESELKELLKVHTNAYVMVRRKHYKQLDNLNADMILNYPDQDMILLKSHEMETSG